MSEGARLLFDDRRDSSRREVDERKDELVRILGLDVEGMQGFRREVLQVGRHDDVGAAANGSGEHVAVVGVSGSPSPSTSGS